MLEVWRAGVFGVEAFDCLNAVGLARSVRWGIPACGWMGCPGWKKREGRRRFFCLLGWIFAAPLRMSIFPPSFRQSELDTTVTDCQISEAGVNVFGDDI